MSSWTTIRVLRRICRQELEFGFNEHREHTIKIINTKIRTNNITEWIDMSPLAKTAVYNSFNFLEKIIDIILMYIIDQKIAPIVTAKYTTKAIDMKLERNIIQKDIEDTFRTGLSDDFLTSNVIENTKKFCCELYTRHENEIWDSCWRNLSYSINTQIHDCFFNAKNEYAQAVGTYIIRNIRNIDEPIYQMIRDHTNKLFWNLRNAAILKICNFISFSISQVIINSSETLPEDIDRDAILTRIDELIGTDSYVEALEVALSCSDDAVIEHVCQRVHPKTIFTVRVCNIPHHLIIKLVRQLGMSLRTNTAFKITYLLRAFRHLDFKELSCREYMLYALKHIPRTVKELLSENPPGDRAIYLTKVLRRSQALLKICSR